MNPNYMVHDQQYQQIRAAGGNGWGGDARLALGPETIERIFAWPKAPQSGRALELGCGEGHLSRLLHERGFTVSGVDVSPTAVGWAQEKAAALGYDIHYWAADVTEPGVLAGSMYDLIHDGACFHCIIGSDRTQFLANVYAALAPGGLFFTGSLCSKGAEDIILERKGRPYRHVGTEQNLVNELERAGFQVMHRALYERATHNHLNLHAVKSA